MACAIKEAVCGVAGRGGAGAMFATTILMPPDSQVSCSTTTTEQKPAIIFSPCYYRVNQLVGETWCTKARNRHRGASSLVWPRLHLHVYSVNRSSGSGFRSFIHKCLFYRIVSEMLPGATSPVDLSDFFRPHNYNYHYHFRHRAGDVINGSCRPDDPSLVIFSSLFL